MRNERVNCFLQMADTIQSTCAKCSILNKSHNRLENMHCSAVVSLTIAWDTEYDTIAADVRVKNIYPFIMADPTHADKVGSIRFFRWISVLGQDIYHLSKSKNTLIKYLASGTVEERTCAAEMLHLYHSLDDIQCHISYTIQMYREDYYLCNLYILCLHLSMWPDDRRLREFMGAIASNSTHKMHDVVRRILQDDLLNTYTIFPDCINLTLLESTVFDC